MSSLLPLFISFLTLAAAALPGFLSRLLHFLHIPLPLPLLAPSLLLLLLLLLLLGEILCSQFASRFCALMCSFTPTLRLITQLWPKELNNKRYKMSVLCRFAGYWKIN